MSIASSGHLADFCRRGSSHPAPLIESMRMGSAHKVRIRRGQSDGKNNLGQSLVQAFFVVHPICLTWHPRGQWCC